MLEVRDLTKAYSDVKRGHVIALNGANFSAAEGMILGLLGPNGAGKTTALRILSTMLRPTSGTAVVNGYDVAQSPEQVRRQIGFVSANTGVYDRMTAWEMIEYFGRLHGMEDDKLHDRMERLFHQMRMDNIRDVLGAKMSTGMKQKASIGRALIHDPPVLIFDEATNGLDVLASRALLETVMELRDHGKCIIYSTHIMREAEKLCDQVVIMHLGRVLTHGTLSDLRARHGTQDLEDLFFELISLQDPDRSQATPPTSVAATSVAPGSAGPTAHSGFVRGPDREAP